MQSINQPQSALIAGMQQGLNYEQPQGGFVQQGFAEGGLASLPRGGYMGGGRTIGGGIIHGTPMGSRTGYWNPIKAAKKAVKKLIPKELAGIMQMAAPFVAPHSMLGAAALSGLGQYKSKGKINPLTLAMSVAPGIRNEHISKLTGGRWDPQDIRGNDNFLRTLLGKTDTGTKIDETLFGKISDANQIKDAGWLGKGGSYEGLGELVKKGGEAILMKGPQGAREVDKMAIVSLALGGMSYVEAKEQIQLQNGIDLEDDLGITEQVWESTDWSQAFANDASYLQGNAKGGIPRTRYAMGTSQFPMTSTRGMYANGGMTWGSDQGEGLGGQEVEADMRYEGGFMPYGEEPKADDVPARLSKDEFVFTDEAVAGAGEGDVEVGAERLYKVMKSLEQGGRLSEESQGEGIGAMI